MPTSSTSSATGTVTPSAGAARASMAGLITRLRRLIGDPAGAAQVWDDEALQDAFDVYQIVHRYERLAASETILPGGRRIYLDFYSQDGVGDWEADVELTDGAYAVLSPTASDLISGHWHFDAPLSNLVVRLSGKSYDIYGSAADVCRQWAATVKLEFDVRTKERQYSRAQQFKMLSDLADQYDGKRLPTFGTMVRMDVSTLPPGLMDVGRGRVRS